MKRAIPLFVAFVLAGALVSLQARAEGWFDVLFKSSEKSGAADAGVQRLYGASKALVIGMDNYTERGWPKLSKGIEDADEVAAVLKRQGFEVKLLTDLTADQLGTAFRDFFIEDGADPTARLVVWYAGHGHTVAGEGYLVPVDAPSATEDVKFRKKALSLRRFGELMREARAKHVLAIFDSCFAGTVFNATRSAPPQAITHVTGLPARQFITSGDAGQTVSDDGLFRRLFVDALEGKEPTADGNGDGYITGTELGQFLFYKITNYTEKRQTPRFGPLNAVGFDGGDFVFGKGTAGVPPARVIITDDVARAWEQIKATTDPELLKAFRGQFGAANPSYDKLAADRLAALSKPAAPARQQPEESDVVVEAKADAPDREKLLRVAADLRTGRPIPDLVALGLDPDGPLALPQDEEARILLHAYKGGELDPRLRKLVKVSLDWDHGKTCSELAAHGMQNSIKASLQNKGYLIGASDEAGIVVQVFCEHHIEQLKDQRFPSLVSNIELRSWWNSTRAPFEALTVEGKGVLHRQTGSEILNGPETIARAIELAGRDVAARLNERNRW